MPTPSPHFDASSTDMPKFKVSIGVRRSRQIDRDLAEQLRTIRTAASKHAAVLATFLPGMGASEPVVNWPGQCRLFDPDVLNARKAAARRADEKLVVYELEKAASLGVLRELARAPTSGDMHALRIDFPHFSQVLDLMLQRSALAAVSPGGAFSMPPVLLSGPPGVGKTAFSDSLAACLKVPLRRIDVASSTASFTLAGSHPTWSSARPGMVWHLLQNSSAAGLLLLDEVDKAPHSSYPVLGPLYSLLERISARHFVDEYIEVPVDASHLTWIATCNKPELLDPALRSRFVEFEIPMPNAAQMVAIARSVYRRLRAEAPWAAVFDAELSEEVTAALTAATPREMLRVLEEAHARAATDRRCRLKPQDVVINRASGPSGPRRIGFV